MNLSKKSVLVLLISIIACVQSSENAIQKKIEDASNRSRMLQEVKKPKPHPSGGGGSPAGDSSSGGGGGSSGGGSSGGGSSGGGGGGGSKGGKSHNPSHASKSISVGPKRKSSAILVAGSLVVGAAWAIAAYRNRLQRQIVVETEHPLQGSISRRVNLFQNFAGGNNKGARPFRVFEMEPTTSYERDESTAGGAMV